MKNKIFSKVLCGFQKIVASNILSLDYFSHGKCHLTTQDMLAQHSMELSKACDCIPRDLLIAKLETYDLDKTSLSLLMDYLSCWKQIIKNRFQLHLLVGYNLWDTIRMSSRTVVI